MVPGIPDVEVPRAVNRYPVRVVQLRRRRRPAIPAEPVFARPRYRRDHPRLRVHPPHPVVQRIPDVEVPRAVNRYPARLPQLRRRRGPAIPAVTLLARPRYRRDDALRFLRLRRREAEREPEQRRRNPPHRLPSRVVPFCHCSSTPSPVRFPPDTGRNQKPQEREHIPLRADSGSVCLIASLALINDRNAPAMSGYSPPPPPHVKRIFEEILSY